MQRSIRSISRAQAVGTMKGNAPSASQRHVPPLGDVLEFLRLLWELDHALQTRSQRMSRELGVTGPQRLVLRLVGRFPGIPAGELARLMHVHPSTVTDIVQRLERDGWLKKRTDSRDGRRALIELTKRGRELDGASRRGTIEAALRRVLARMRPSEVEATRRLLRGLAGELRDAAS